ncbi:polyphosphate:nucleotide phosphotransferase, PPK2 family [Micromonospora pattaloongensis]|uniref:Polyphosphate:nucleotide phosphotransferase, PPK2 family n=1 Tax=Micromonospora pattaloongensis TaxID=405436 RepID=A0A1H3GYR4_9ACTN|nr:PPK2 family polyphosphate kinase [Micromonospora pattaloongensis]SDY08463.1 polyphosphate:nucleotide phosphotransferase, PPK2 family [Micromonospora pattaloongensis]
MTEETFRLIRPRAADISLRRLLRVDGEAGPVRLDAIDPRSTPGLPPAEVVGDRPKLWARAQLAGLGAELARQQEMLVATAKRAGSGGPRVLVVLQAMDAGGKDGVVKRVAGAMNPLGLHIRAFGPPTDEQRRHHFLWRVRRALPAPGQVGIFNRSHYEDVLIARVESLVPEEVWRARYDEINDFEAELRGSGVSLVKVMLHISYEEQRDRLLARLDDPTKHWKYDPADVDARARWGDYRAAYAEALSRTSTPAAPWHVVPADRKWYRDWAVAQLLRETFAELGLRYPAADFDVAAERTRLLRDAESEHQVNAD